MLDEARFAAVVKRLGIDLHEADRIVAMVRGHTDEKGRVRKLSPREMDVFELIGQCKSSAEIAAELGISAKTLDVHRLHLKAKLDTSTQGLVRAWTVWCLLGRLGDGA